MGVIENVEKIKTSRYGKDVRNAIADSILDMNAVALDAQSKAETAQDSAMASAEVAEGAAALATASATKAEGFVEQATTASQSAEESKNSASESASQANQSASQAGESATASAEALTLAQDEAEKAQASATNAQTSATNAQTSAENAQTSAENAQSSAENAQSDAENAQESAQNASTSEENASNSATLAQSWAVGGTGARADEDINNAKYWAQQAKEAVGGDYIPTADKGVPGGVASLDATGKVPKEQLPDMDYIPSEDKGAAGGVASLDENGKVPEEQLPMTKIDVDEELSEESENPVQNKVIAQKLGEVDETLGNKAETSDLSILDKTVIENKLLGWSTPKESPIQNEINGKQFIQKVGRLDIGTLQWAQPIEDNKTFFWGDFYYGSKINGKSYCSTELGAVYIHNVQPVLCIKTFAETTAVDVKNNLKNKYCYYELATPIVMDIDDLNVFDKSASITSEIWNTNISYSIGKLCIYNNTLWKCLVANTGITPKDGVSEWKRTSIADEIETLSSRITNNSNNIFWNKKKKSSIYWENIKKGWYRVAILTDSTRLNGLITISTVYRTSSNESRLLSVSGGHGIVNFSLLNKIDGDAHNIEQIRAVRTTDGKCAIDLYYNYTGYKNDVYITIDSEDNSMVTAFDFCSLVTDEPLKILGSLTL